jgi:hypothetical protein
MKRSMVMAIVLVAVASIARADNLVNVVFNPADFGSAGGVPFETIELSFTWDTTTQTLSNFVLTSEGPVTGFSSTPTAVLFNGPEIDLLNFSDGKGDVFQLDYGFHGGLIQPRLSSTPGTYPLDLNLECQGDPRVCTGTFTNVFDTATVTAVVSTSEPGTLALVGVGLVGLLGRKRKKSALDSDFCPKV